MKRGFRAINIFFAIFPLMTASGFAVEPPLPRMEGKEAVATVNGDPITVEELNQALRRYPWTVLSEMKGDAQAIRKLEETEKPRIDPAGFSRSGCSRRPRNRSLATIDLDSTSCPFAWPKPICHSRPTQPSRELPPDSESPFAKCGHRSARVSFTRCWAR